MIEKYVIQGNKIYYIALMMVLKDLKIPPLEIKYIEENTEYIARMHNVVYELVY